MVLRTIKDAFDDEGVLCNFDYVPDGVGGERRTLVEQYYSTVDFTNENDITKVLRAFESILSIVPDSTKEYLTKILQRNDYKFEKGRISLAVDIDNHRLPTMGWASGLAGGFGLPQLRQQIKRITDSVDTDPDLAVGTSKELLETCCKTILSERGLLFNENEDISKLLKNAQKSLKLLPDDIDQRAKGTEYIKRLLGNLGGIARGMSEVRNQYGTGHGKHGRSSSLKPRHAKLAAGAATTLAVFLFETHIETRERIP